MLFVQRTIPPNGVAYDLYIADSADNIIRRVAGDTGIITTIAGPGVQGNLGDGGPATKAELRWPTGIAVDAHGDVFIADTGSRSAPAGSYRPWQAQVREGSRATAARPIRRT